MAFLNIIQPILISLSSIFIGLFGISFIIAFHELGHLLFSKIFNVHVESFSIGFGPKLLEKKIGETNYAISLIPLGGYVETEADENNPRSITCQSYLKKMLIVSGGILFNLIFSYLVLIFLTSTGLPANNFFKTNTPLIINTIVKDTPAFKSELKRGDTLISLNNTLIKSIKDLSEEIKKTSQLSILKIKRDSELLDIPITFDLSNPIKSLGVKLNHQSMNLIDSVSTSSNMLIEGICATFKGFTNIISKKDTNQLAGPLMMISITSQSIAHSFSFFLLLLSIISISLAVLNVFPLPILDGGQALFYTLEAISGRQIPDNIRNAIGLGCWILMLILILCITYKDVITLFFS